MTEHDLCIKTEEKMQKQAAQLAKENEDLHVWVERETHRAAEQQMQIVAVQMLNRKLTAELEAAQ